MKTLLPLALILITAQAASAQRRGGKPFHTANGRTTSAPPAAPAPAPAAAAGGAAANGPAPQAGGVLRAGVTMYGPSSGSRAAMGRSTRSVGRPEGRSIGFIGARRASGAGAGQGAGGVGATTTSSDPAPPPAQEAPAHFSKPGALIRDTGQQPIYQETATRTHTVDAGEIVLNRRKAAHVGSGPGVQMGPKDTPPPPNPNNLGSYTRSGAAPNGAAPNGSGSGSGGDNNGSGNNGKDKPGDDDDQHGGDKAKEAAFYDAF